MLRTQGNAHYRFLDFQDAEPGDRFCCVRHTPYGDRVCALEMAEVIAVDAKRVHCQLAGRKKRWSFRKMTEQPDCYVEEDPLFQSIALRFRQTERVDRIKGWIQKAPVEAFDDRVCTAIEDWHRRRESPESE